MMLIAVVVAFAWIVLMKYFAGIMIWVSQFDDLEFSRIQRFFSDYCLGHQRTAYGIDLRLLC